LISLKNPSLSQRLLWALGLVSLSFWAAIAALTTGDNIEKVDELYDIHLARTAKAFLHLMDPDDEAAQNLPSTLSPSQIEALFSGPATAESDSLASKRMNYGDKLRYQLWRDNGELMLRSSNAPESVMTLDIGFSENIDSTGHAWRHYSFHDQHHGVRIIVSEPREFRQQLLRSIVLNAAAPLLLGLPLLLWLLWFFIKRSLQPLDALRQEISMRKKDNLIAINIDHVPEEVRPLVGALNALLDRMAQTLEQERRFTDDAAHQLRTPLATIQAHLYAFKHAKERAQSARALEHIQQGVIRATHLVNQLLNLARLEPSQQQEAFSSVQLGDIAQSVCAELAPLMLQREQTLELMVAPDLPSMPGDADMLAMLISNLLDNAIHYTQQGGHITIGITADGNVLQLVVCDDGPGIAAELREKVFERFYRIAPQSQPGTGLGLAICKRVAELHQASVSLEDGLNGTGLIVRVYFPLQGRANTAL